MKNITLKEDKEDKLNQISKVFNKTLENIVDLALNEYIEKFQANLYFTNNPNFFIGEIWKSVPGFEDYYEASNLGRIKSLDRTINKFNPSSGENCKMFRKGQIFKLRYNPNRRYISIKLSKNSKELNTTVQRIIALTFIPNPNNLPQVNHKNGIKTDNRVENLDWVDNSQNVKHALEMGLNTPVCGENHGSAVFTNEQVLEIRELYKKGGTSYSQIAKQFNVNKGRIYEIVKRKTWKHI